MFFDQFDSHAATILSRRQVLKACGDFVVVVFAAAGGVGVVGNSGNLAPALAQTYPPTTIHSFNGS